MALSLLQQLRLVLWKNFMVQWRRKLGTFSELILPILFFGIIVGLKQLGKIEDFPTAYQETGYATEQLPWPSASKIIYYPNTGDVAQVMARVSQASQLSNNTEMVFEGEKSLADFNYNGLGATNVVGVLFDGDGSLAANSSFSLRFPSNPICTQKGKQCDSSNDKTWTTMYIYSSQFFTKGPQLYDNKFEENDYFYSGFLRLQYEVSKAIINVKAGNAAADAPLFGILESFLQLFPYAEYRQNYFATFGVQMTIPLVVTLSYIYPVLALTRDMVREKELVLKESMKLMGMKSIVYWLGWFIKAFAMHIIPLIIICIMLVASSTVEYVNIFVIFVFMLLYLISLIAFSFMVSVFFSSAKIAAIVSGILFMLLNTPSNVMRMNMESFSSGQLAASCLAMNTCMSWGWTELGRWEEVVTNMGFGQLGNHAYYGDQISMVMVFGMLVLDTVIYFLIAFYVDQVFPGQYGVSKPWYFLFAPSFWCKSKAEYVDDANLLTNQSSNGLEDPNIEADPVGLKAGVSIQHMSKRYNNRKVAVNDLSLNMYNDQITCLLGHNGAGKSTTMHILTGVYEPTSGTAIVNGYDIRKDMDMCRESMGLCAQINTLFEALTVEEQLYFFGRLKGLGHDEIGHEVEVMLQDTHLEDKRHDFPSSLSGGMKRKLCVAIALIAGSHVVFLDEPTSGMDPSARRATWELITKYKPGRTIVLTTHFMDEADLLGNRIAIMAEGKVRACGTSLFLKKRFGMGYQMIVEKNEQCSVPKLVELVKAHVPNARLLSNSGAELAFELPDEDSGLFEALFGAMESDDGTLGIETFGIACTTMEEVFLKVGKMVEEEDAGQKYLPTQQQEPPLTEKQSLESNSSDDKRESFGALSGSEHGIQSEHEKLMPPGPRLTAQRFWALLVKRYLSAKRDWKLAILQLLLPIIFTILSMVLAKLAADPTSTVEGALPVWLTMDAYEKPELPWTNDVVNAPLQLQQTADAVAREYGAMPHNLYIPRPTNIVDYIVEQHRERGIEFLTRDLGAFSLQPMAGNKVNSTVYISTEGFHAAPTILNVQMNALLQAATGDQSLAISVANKPFPRDVQVEAAKNVMQDMTGYNIAFFLVFGYGFLYGSFVLFIIKERTSKAKHLQVVCGVSPVTYWLSTYTWDVLNSLIPIGCVMIVLVAFQVTAYMTGSNMGLVFLLLLLFTLAYVPFMYIVSWFFKVPTTGMSMAIIINLITGMATLITVNTLRFIAIDDLSLYKPTRIVTNVMYLFPNFAFGIGMGDLFFNWQLLEACKLVVQTVVKPDMIPGLVAAGAIPAKYQNNIGEICTAKDASTPYLDKLMAIPTEEFHVQRSYLAWDNPGIGKSLVAMSIGAVVYFVIAMLIEFNFFLPRRTGKDRHGPSTIDDEDVARERKRVTVEDNARDDMVLIQDLSKVYPKKGRKQKSFLAVDHISLGIKSGECFGLLGVNGAGKTTTFSMLTGDLRPTSGNIFIGGYNVIEHSSEARKCMGYCPQFDALIERLTGRETLLMYARLRGVDPSRQDAVVTSTIERLNLAAYTDKLCGTYSGGNKRKLSTGMALVGDPPVILLDEPTTGVDPSTRRFVWDILAELAREGRCLVLTSHSMEECEALCTRLTIMVSGQLRCVGSVQHLKNRFGQGFQVFLKAADSSNTSDAKSFMQETFPGCVLKEEHQGLLTYSVPKAGNKWSTIFGKLEAAKTRLGLVDYSVSQTTLEQLFIGFTQEQELANDKLEHEDETDS